MLFPDVLMIEYATFTEFWKRIGATAMDLREQGLIDLNNRINSCGVAIPCIF